MIADAILLKLHNLVTFMVKGRGFSSVIKIQKNILIPNTRGITDLDTWSILVAISKSDLQIYGDSTVYWSKVKHASMYIVKQADC